MNEMTPEPMPEEPFTIDGETHERGKPECPVCWNEPKPCECGGLIHSAFGDENADCDYWLYHCCDKCGSTDSPE